MFLAYFKNPHLEFVLHVLRQPTVMDLDITHIYINSKHHSSLLFPFTYLSFPDLEVSAMIHLLFN